MSQQDDAWVTMRKNQKKREELVSVLQESPRKEIKVHETKDSYIAIIKK